MALNGIGAPASRQSSSMSRSAEETASPEQRALVAATEITSGESHHPYSRRPAAPFLAHLIATASGAPQTRERRRTQPDAAAEAYAAVSARLNGVIFRKS
jgi:hypothetical protein